MRFKRYLPFTNAILALASMEIYFFWPAYLFASLVASSVMIIVSIRLMSLDNLIDRHWWNYSILPLSFFNGLNIYAAILPYKNNIPLLQGLFILSAIFLYYYLRSAYYHLVLPTAERSTNLENISSFGNFLSFFFIASTVFGLQSFLGVPSWQLIMIIVAVCLFLIYQAIWSLRASVNHNLPFILIGSLVISEIAWSLFYLPFNFNISGGILAVEYYILTGILRAYSHNKLDSKILKIYLGFGLLSIFVILITARWL